MTSIGRPGPMTEQERFLFDVAGYLVIPGAFAPEEVEACLEAARRVHADLPLDRWRQLGAAYEAEPAFESLIDRPSALPRVRALLRDYFILQGIWCTVAPPGFSGGGCHQDGSGVYEFRRLAVPTPLRRALVGEWSRPEGPFGTGYARAPFDGSEPV